MNVLKICILAWCETQLSVLTQLLSLYHLPAALSLDHREKEDTCNDSQPTLDFLKKEIEMLQKEQEKCEV